MKQSIVLMKCQIFMTEVRRIPKNSDFKNIKFCLTSLAVEHTYRPLTKGGLPFINVLNLNIF